MKRGGFLLTLEGGPCAGSYETAYAREQLQAVRDSHGRLDVLDAPDDVPTEDEEVFAYVVDERRGPGHLCGRGGCRQLLSYRYLGEVDRETGEIRGGGVDLAMSERIADTWQREELEAFKESLRSAAAAPTQEALF